MAFKRLRDKKGYCLFVCMYIRVCVYFRSIVTFLYSNRMVLKKLMQLEAGLRLNFQGFQSSFYKIYSWAKPPNNTLVSFNNNMHIYNCTN